MEKAEAAGSVDSRSRQNRGCSCCCRRRSKAADQAMKTVSHLQTGQVERRAQQRVQADSVSGPVPCWWLPTRSPTLMSSRQTVQRPAIWLGTGLTMVSGPCGSSSVSSELSPALYAKLSSSSELISIGGVGVVGLGTNGYNVRGAPASRTVDNATAT